MLALLSSPARLAFSAGIVAVSVAGVVGLASSALFSSSEDLAAGTFVYAKLIEGGGRRGDQLAGLGPAYQVRLHPAKELLHS